MAPKTSRFPETYRSCRCRRVRQSSIRQENIWQFMRQNWLSNQIFKSFDDIVDHCCYAWNTLIDQPWKSCPSHAATGPSSVSQFEDWY